MKQILFVITLTIITSLKAQEVHFGIRLGANHTTLNTSGEDVVAQKYANGKYGINFGLLTDLMISEHFAVSGELNYAMGGDDYSYFDTRMTAYTSYIQVPVMAKVFIGDNLYFHAGPQVSYMISAVGESNFNGEIISENIKNDFKSIDFGIDFGAGLKFKNDLFLDLRYSEGLYNISKDKVIVIKNRAMVFSIGYYFN
jgi:hypothetical protein